MSPARLPSGRLRTPLVVLCLVLPAALGVTDGAAQERRPMTLVDLVELPSLGDPRLSPDGTQLLYVRSEADWEENRTISHVWRVDSDGTDAVQLTTGKEGQSSPRWSPDGSWIAFLADREDEEDREVYLIPNAGGEARVLTRHATGVSSIQWSPDGRWIYFVAPEPESDAEERRKELHDDVFALDEDWKPRHLWRVEVATGDEERVTSGDFSLLGYSLSRDGRRIAHHRAPTPLYDDSDEGEVWVMDADGGNATRLTDNGVPESGAELSPDGRTVLFTAGANADFDFYYNDNLFLVPAAGGEPRLLLPDMPYEVAGATWSADGRHVYFGASTGVRRELFRVEVETETLERLTEGDHALRSWSYRPELERHVFSIDGPENPGDIWLLRTDGSGTGPERVTRVFDALVAPWRLPRQEVVTYEGRDGAEVEALLFWPLDYREGQRYPLVVQTHGGPASSDMFTFGNSHDYTPVLTAMGYFVLQPNYRGSTGYGDAFMRDMVGQYFNEAHRDVMGGVDYLIERGLVDGERMAKMGWSAGGHMTNKIITYTDRFRAASSGAGAANWISMYAQSDVRIYRTPWFGGTPWEEDAPVDQYLEDSPILDVSRVTTPTIFLVGQNDARVPMPQSVEMFRGLRSNGVPTHLYVAPREGHGWQELRHRLFKANVELDWFERWVRDREYAWEEAPGTEKGASPSPAGT